MNSQTYQELFSYLLKNEYPVTFSKNDKRQLRNKSNGFQIQNGLLMKKDRTQNPTQVIQEDQVDRILESCHSDQSGHFGRDKTALKISQRFWWPNMNNHIRRFVAICQQCQRSNPLNKQAHVLQPLTVTSQVWHTVGIDLIGPFTESANGNRYIFTGCDLFSKWPLAIGIPDKTASTIATTLYKVFLEYGCCKVLITDQGSEFNNETNRRLKELMNVRHNVTSPYHPQSNGQVERWN